MPMSTPTEKLLQHSVEHIGRLARSIYSKKDEGMLEGKVRREIYQQLREEARDEAEFRLVIARLSSLCAHAMAHYLSPQDEAASAMLSALSAHIDAGDISGLHEEIEQAQAIFDEADRCTPDETGDPFLKDEDNQQAILARVTLAQAVRLATGGIEDEHMNAYIRRISPDLWMPELWAACTVANGLPQFEHSQSHKMRHFWVWYLTTGIPLALDLSHSTTEPQFTPPPESAPPEIKQYASPWGQRPTGDPLITRTPFLFGYIEKVVDQKGRTERMKFIYDGRSNGKFWVDYKRRQGTYVDEQYGGINYQSGRVEEVHLSHLASSEDNVPIEHWVSEMEATLLRDVLSSRFKWFFGWAGDHWEEPFQPELHRDDMRLCMDSIERVFRASEITVEEARPYHQIMWCFCAFALDEQVDRAKKLFNKAWEADGSLFRDVERSVMEMVERHR